MHNDVVIHHRIIQVQHIVTPNSSVLAKRWMWWRSNFGNRLIKLLNEHLSED